MTSYLGFRLQQRPPVRPIVQIFVKQLFPAGDFKGVFIDEIRGETEIDTTINILIKDCETIRKKAKEELKKQISMLKK